MQSKKGFDLDPNRLTFGEMTRFYCQHIWVEDEEWDDGVTLVRERRNAVHAFNHRELGTWDEFWQAVARYRESVDDLDSRVPYPDASDYA